MFYHNSIIHPTFLKKSQCNILETHFFGVGLIIWPPSVQYETVHIHYERQYMYSMRVHVQYETLHVQYDGFKSVFLWYRGSLNPGKVTRQKKHCHHQSCQSARIPQLTTLSHQQHCRGQGMFTKFGC